MFAILFTVLLLYLNLPKVFTLNINPISYILIDLKFSFAIYQ